MLLTGMEDAHACLLVAIYTVENLHKIIAKQAASKDKNFEQAHLPPLEGDEEIKPGVCGVWFSGGGRRKSSEEVVGEVRWRLVEAVGPGGRSAFAAWPL